VSEIYFQGSEKIELESLAGLIGNNLLQTWFYTRCNISSSERQYWIFKVEYFTLICEKFNFYTTYPTQLTRTVTWQNQTIISINSCMNSPTGRWIVPNTRISTQWTLVSIVVVLNSNKSWMNVWILSYKNLPQFNLSSLFRFSFQYQMTCADPTTSATQVVRLLDGPVASYRRLNRVLEAYNNVNCWTLLTLLLLLLLSLL